MAEYSASLEVDLEDDGISLADIHDGEGEKEESPLQYLGPDWGLKMDEMMCFPTPRMVKDESQLTLGECSK